MDLALQLRDFLPISQLESFYKPVAKVLVGRLAGVMDKIISPNQSVLSKGGISWMEWWL